jgi:hypothetical protein
VSGGAACGNFEWQVTSQSGGHTTGNFSATCLGTSRLNGTATGDVVNDTTVNISVTGMANLSGLDCSFSLSGVGHVEGSDSVRIGWSATTCMGPFSGTETLRRSAIPGLPAPPPQAPPPPPPPPPAPTPEPPPASSADEIDLRNVTWVLGPNDVWAWPQTSTVTGTKQVPHELCIWHTKLGQWPSVIFFNDPNTLVEGNQWVVANIGGRWYGGAADWYRPGQACKDVTADTIAADAFYYPEQEPLRSWRPAVGEVFGLFSTTPARAWPAMRTVDQRSNIVLVRWGQ